MHTQAVLCLDVRLRWVHIFFLFYSGKKSIYVNTCSIMSSGLDDLGMGTSRLSTSCFFSTLGCNGMHTHTQRPNFCGMRVVHLPHGVHPVVTPCNIPTTSLPQDASKCRKKECQNLIFWDPSFSWKVKQDMLEIKYKLRKSISRGNSGF